MNNLKIKNGESNDILHLFTSRVSVLFSNGLLILLIPHYLDSVSQGYYFAFIGLSAIQTAFDFGMSQTIMQMVIHAYAAGNFSKVHALISYSNKWLKKSAFFFVTIVFPCGIYYFNYSIKSAPVGWAYIWFVFIVFSGFNMLLSSRLTIIEGLGSLSRVAKLRSTQNLVGVLFTCIALFFDFGLFSIIIIPAVSALLAYIWLEYIYNFEFQNELPFKFTSEDKREIFNLQWRIGSSWVCGYAVQQSIAPIIFGGQGAITAGQFGLTLALFNAISIVSLSWVAAHAPNFASYASLLQRDKLHTLFKRSLLRSIACTIFLTALLLVILGYSQIIPTDRVLSGIPLFSLAMVCLANSIILPIAVVLRAHKKEPTLIMGIVTGIIMIGVIMQASRERVEIIAIGYAAVTLLIALPWTIIIYSKFLKKYYG